MKKVLRVFHSFEEAERADEEYYASLTPQQRLNLLLEIIAAYREALGESAARMEKVCRLTRMGRD